MELVAYGATCLGLVWGWTTTPHGAPTRKTAAIKIIETLMLSLFTFYLFDLEATIITIAYTLLAILIHGLWLKSLREGRMK